MRAEWEPDELIDVWTLVKGDRDLIANKAGATRLGFAVMLKFSEIEDLFPTYREEVPQAAVDYLGSLVRVEPALFAKYSWRGRTIEYHRAQIRRAYGTRPSTESDEDRWAQWLAALEFRCNHSAYRPVMDAIDLLARYAGTDSDQKLYAAAEKVPVDGVVPKAWLDGVVDDDGRVERIPYELCVLIALREALRRREVYVQGAGRWKDPDEDLPGDFEDHRDLHYAALAKR